jgi:lipopolysaccharide transport system ATP-binding protein
MPERTVAPDDIALSVTGLSKTYRITRRDEAVSTAAEAVIRRVRERRGGRRREEFDAVHDVSFDVHRGEVLGIIGRNGAGKSTLLKMITRITAPTAGRIELAGRVGSLLEVGTGFHPELTGRENIYLNGTLLGMRRKEIRRHFDEIVAFAGTERFLDTQVKRYSTGMYVRLAFAVAAHLEAEILVVDEVLAVGDSDFQAKCLRKMRDVARGGRTVLVVSHQLQTVSDLCTSAIYLESGRLLAKGTVEEAMEAYKRSFDHAAPMMRDAAHRPGTGEIRILEAKVTDDITKPGNEVEIEFTVAANPEFGNRYHVSCLINNEDGMVIAQCDSRVVDFFGDPATDVHVVLRMATPWLKPGAYNADLVIHAGGHPTDIWEQAVRFQVLPVTPYPNPSTPDATDRGVVYPQFEFLQVCRFAVPKLADLWEAREVLYRFGARDVTLRYRQTALGVTWVVLQPLLTSVVFVVVFHGVAHLSTNGLPPILVPFTGLLAFNIFSGVVSRAQLSLVANRDLVSKVFFPRMLVPLAVVYSNLIDFVVTMAFLVVMLVFYGVAPAWGALPLVPVWALMMVLLSSGVGLITSALTVRYRDVTYVIPFLIQFLTFASPVGYLVSSIHKYKWFFDVNPITWIINEFRWSFLNQPAPPGWQIALSIVVPVVSFVAFAVVFEQMERSVADLI